MSERARTSLGLGVVMLCALAVLLVGIRWGLPSRDADGYLFGDRQVWSGEQILALAGEREYAPRLGADVDRTPLPRDRIIVLNETDEQRAAIIRRYRLYTYQPDEMITMMSLAQMRPAAGDFDPRLYQYGGLWIYPVGVLLRVASAAGLITLTSDLAFYLDHPEQFGRFYIVARAYVAAWALVGVWTVFWLARRARAGLYAPLLAAALFVLMPVVVNMGHEAKPHLPGAVLMLLAVMAAVKYVETGSLRWAVAAGGLCGAAFGMVLSSLLIFLILPVMLLLRPQPVRRRAELLAGAATCGVIVYFLTNPYVAINLVVNREVIRSNIENSAAMYEIADWPAGLANASRLLIEGASVPVVLVAIVGLAVMARRKSEAGAASGGAVAWLLAVPSAAIFVQFVALAAGKPGEYGRFALLPCIALAIAAASVVDAVARHTFSRAAIAVLLIAGAGLFGFGYLRGFVRDVGPEASRLAYAELIDDLRRDGHRTIALVAEPAPYSMPPVDLFHWQLLLLPEDFELAIQDAPADVIVRAVDVPRPIEPEVANRYELLSPPTPRVGAIHQQVISWADKPFQILLRIDKPE